MQDPSLGVSAETLLARFSSFQDGPNEQAQCMFLTYILTACLTAIVRGEDELDLPQTKAELVAEVVAVLEQVVAEPTPGNILPCALVALHHLSKMKPHTPWELEDRFLSLAIHAVLRLEEPSYNYVGQSLYRSSQQTLEVLLLGLLDEDSSSDHLFAILDIMGDALGRYVAELGVLLMDPKRQVGRHAREGIYRLYELALQQRGIDIREMAGLWIREPHLDWEMASYRNTVQMAKVRRPPGLVPWLPFFLPRRAGAWRCRASPLPLGLPFLSHNRRGGRWGGREAEEPLGHGGLPEDEK
ncbi:hypothetical protein JRQ81_017548 [Phrynocephalus forsythii]|uniref:Uncharacterized protein n=1 Tax=Phrynocephalus forsythii TaxID=171643 RepID=A0A9Q0XR61_9SAUR|nr:hypothetical protein JRQ81_017548 [Phrynocephalus forsythii]